MKTKFWIARDKNGELYLYTVKPNKYDIMFDNDDIGEMLKLDKDSHPEITWENSPQQIKI